MKIYKEFTFEAAHHLPLVFEKGHPNHRLHGHSFRARITLNGTPDPQTGLIEDLGRIHAHLDKVRNQLDHHYLNEEVEGLTLPTLENITRWIWQQVQKEFPQLYEVSVHRDTCGEGCIYNGSLEERNNGEG